MKDVLDLIKIEYNNELDELSIIEFEIIEHFCDKETKEIKVKYKYSNKTMSFLDRMFESCERENYYSDIVFNFKKGLNFKLRNAIIIEHDIENDIVTFLINDIRQYKNI